MKLSVIIVNYNVKYYLEQCLDSVLKAIRNIESEVWVVDNASSDKSLEYLTPRFPMVKFVSNNSNAGFAKANNLAIGQSSSEYVLLLNPDTILSENTIENCIDWMENCAEAGGTGVKMLGADGAFALESRRGFPSLTTSFYKVSGLCNLFPRSHRFGKYYLRFLDKNTINPIDIISGAYMLLRREALDKTGLLDESFFMYGEDIDMSYRITLAGYKNYYIPSSIIHYKGESTKKDSFKYVYTFYDAMIIFFKKHYPSYNIFFSLVVKSGIYLCASVASVTRVFKIFGKEKPLEFRFLVIGSKTALRDIEHICTKNNLLNDHFYIVGNEDTVPQGHLNSGVSLEKYTHVIYDTDAFSYSKIIDLLEISAKESKIKLGTFSSKSKVLITPEQVFL